MHLLKKWRWRFGFHRAVRAQVRTGRPPEVRQVFATLRAMEFSSWRAYRMLAAAYEAEVAAMLIDDRLYDHEAYLQVLEALPVLPQRTLDQVSATGRPGERS